MINVRNRAVIPERQPHKMRPSQAAASEAVTLTAKNRAPYMPMSMNDSQLRLRKAIVSASDRLLCVCVCACVCVRVRAFCDTSY